MEEFKFSCVYCGLPGVSLDRSQQYHHQCLPARMVCVYCGKLGDTSKGAVSADGHRFYHLKCGPHAEYRRKQNRKELIALALSIAGIVVLYNVLGEEIFGKLLMWFFISIGGWVA